MSSDSLKENFRLALADEARNRLLYLAFAEKAEAEGRHQLARLFRATAESELIHARRQMEAAGVIGSSADNLRHAVAAEEREFQDSYAEYLRQAQKEGDSQAAALFGKILKVEREHHRMFLDTLAKLLAGQDLAAAPIHVCQVCGSTVVGKRPGACGICGSPAEAFNEID
jgi:rubrerythrin